MQTDIVGVSDLTEWKGESWGRKAPSLWVLFSPSATSWQPLTRFENHQYRLSHSIPITTVGGRYSYPHFIDELKKWVGVNGSKLLYVAAKWQSQIPTQVYSPQTLAPSICTTCWGSELSFQLITLYCWHPFFPFCVFVFTLFIITCSEPFLLGTFLARILRIPSIYPRRSLYRSGKCFPNYILNYNFKVTYLSYSPRDFS